MAIGSETFLICTRPRKWSNGSCGTGSGAPFSLSASLSYDAAPQAGGAAGPAIPTQPSGGWVNNWQNNLALSGSGLEALGSSDPRAAAGAIVADGAMDLFSLEELFICPWALREGVILRRLDALAGG